jgi:hypothetical protein
MSRRGEPLQRKDICNASDKDYGNESVVPSSARIVSACIVLRTTWFLCLCPHPLPFAYWTVPYRTGPTRTCWHRLAQIPYTDRWKGEILVRLRRRDQGRAIQYDCAYLRLSIERGSICSSSVFPGTTSKARAGGLSRGSRNSLQSQQYCHGP